VVILATIRPRLRLTTGEPLLVETGSGPLLESFAVSVHAPEVEVARRV
jgi:hypothetical protein